MRRATITLTDELEALVDGYLARLEAPPSLTALVQAALRQYLEERPASGASVSGAAPSEIAEDASGYDGRSPSALELEPDLELALRRAATREGISVGELAREILAQSVRGLGRPTPRGLGEYRSGRSDVASRAEEILGRAARSSR